VRERRWHVGTAAPFGVWIERGENGLAHRRRQGRQVDNAVQNGLTTAGGIADDETPAVHIGCDRWLFTTQDFGGHPALGSSPLVGGACVDERGEAEVKHVRGAVGADQHVGGFEISVHHVGPMNGADCLNE
jgi:hypothetical protein